jgi:hypothetical protein
MEHALLEAGVERDLHLKLHLPPRFVHIEDIELYLFLTAEFLVAKGLLDGELPKQVGRRL